MQAKCDFCGYSGPAAENPGDDRAPVILFCDNARPKVRVCEGCLQSHGCLAARRSECSACLSEAIRELRGQQ
jgi:hypothetical protein